MSTPGSERERLRLQSRIRRAAMTLSPVTAHRLWPGAGAPIALMGYGYDELADDDCARGHRKKNCKVRGLEKCCLCGVAFRNDGSYPQHCQGCADWNAERERFLGMFALEHDDRPGQQKPPLPLFAADRYDWSTLEWMPAEIFMWDSPDWIFVGDPKQCAVCGVRRENRISYMRVTESGAERASVCSDCEYDANRKKDPLTGPIDSIEHLELVLAGDISARPWMTKSRRSRCPSSPQHAPVHAKAVPT